MFEKATEILWPLMNDKRLMEAQDKLRKMGVRSHVPMRLVGLFDDDVKDEASPEDSEKLAEYFDEFKDGLKAVDQIIEELTWTRGILVEQMLAIRDAYTPKFKEGVDMLSAVAGKKDGDSGKAKAAFAAAMGLRELPWEVANIDVATINGERDVVVRFGVPGKPTSVAVVFPAKADLSRRYSGAAEHPEDCSVDLIECFRPAVSLYVDMGVSADRKTNVHADCLVSELPDKISKIMEIDARDNIRKVESVMSCKNVSDFREWRMLRAANRSAEENSDENRG